MTGSRWKAGIAGLAVAAAITLPGAVSSAAPGDAQLTFINGIDSGPVDVYIDGALAGAGIAYGVTVDAERPAGTYTIEVCAAEDPAPDPLPGTGCTTSANYPNGGVDITVANNETYTVVGQYAGAGQAAGRPTVIAYLVDLDCVEPGEGRIGFLHAANALNVDVLLDASVVFSDVAPETDPPPTTDRVGGAVDIAMVINETGGGTELFTTQVTNLPIRNSTALVFVGNPDNEVSYDLLSIDYPVEDCAPATTTTTTTAPTTTTTAPPAVTPVVVTPVFTG
jgi:hypothetical protein